MWSNLVVFHSESKERDRIHFPGLLSWKTCMRTVYIGDSRIMEEKHLYPIFPYEIYRGYKAYQLLLEIISGIRSRLLGETEVLNQFKEEFQTSKLPNTPFGDYMMKLRDQLIEDSRKLRSKYLRGLGDQSYGGLVHRVLGLTKDVTIIGTGQLAEQVIPWIRQKRNLTIVGRNQERLDFLSLKFQASFQYFGQKLPQSAAYIICAPISIRQWIHTIPKNSLVIDLREDGMGDFEDSTLNYYSFESILAILKENEEKNKKLRKDLEIIVSKIVEEREFDSLNYINGWEDIPCLAY
jgi:glutamyl-tRNA reductase